MKTQNILWILAVIFAAGTVIDVIDGYMPKLISSVAITIALVMFALAQSAPGKKLFNKIGGICLAVAAVAFVYRLFYYYNII